ncbi:hypothetical protein [Thalassotalea mangrovi]|uniref:Uncharacterized protein n=1 Tax=Thalassotalea mangrovi TaxID=2572245 RepID=A0A4U1B4Q8_9GAMM|nr:hypothetical protein [Thalassotalea mangrovi]TKB45370.1 hypothetical protein E8M12_09240 [Thalassotalea mangrovi]
MNYKLILTIAVLLCTGFKSHDVLKPVSQIKPGAAAEGSLANQKLIADTTSGLEDLIGESISDSEVLKFVIQQPVGEIGSRSWREMWIVKSPEKKQEFLITFREAGLGGADFEIKQTSFNCPKNITKFEVGVATSMQIKGCMGKPNHEDFNPDGRYVFLYETEEGIIVTYLFDSNDKLVKVTGYQKS